MYQNINYICLVIALLVLVASIGCSSRLSYTRQTPAGRTEINIADIISHAYDAACTQAQISDTPTSPMPAYARTLLADGKLTIGIGIGTPDLGDVSVPDRREKRYAQGEYMLYGKKITVAARLILSKDAFKKALSDCEIIYITSHSRFGAGPVFLSDGKAHPFTMQRTLDYEIIMPKQEVCGYRGTVKKTYQISSGKAYTVFEPNGTDLDNSVAYPGYQLLVLSTCFSKRHFLDEIQQFRKDYPTTAIFTTRACCMDITMRVVMRMICEVFQGKPVGEVVAAMNEEYREVSWNFVRKRISQWRVINNLYSIGINTVQ